MFREVFTVGGRSFLALLAAINDEVSFQAVIDRVKQLDIPLL